MPQEIVWVFLIPIAAIVGGCTITIVGIMARARVREAEIRERIAMIERGLVPAPESDPAGFEAMVRRQRRTEPPRHPARFRRGGIVVIGVGLGMMVLFGTTGENDGVGIGAFVAIIGLALFVSSFVSSGAGARGDFAPGPIMPAHPAPPAAAPRGPSSPDSL